MRILCQKCGEIGSDQERWFYGMWDEDKMPIQTIEKMCQQKCKKCGGGLYTENGKYTKMHDGSPYREPTLAEKVGIGKIVNAFMKQNKKAIKKEKRKIDAEK